MTRRWPPTREEMAASTRRWPAVPVAGGEFAAQSFGLLADATEFDGNNIATGADVSNGYEITLVGTAANRDLPAIAGAAGGAVWSWAGIPTMDGEEASSFEPHRARTAIRVYEVAVPATAPSQIRIGFGFSDNASPLLATSGMFFVLDYNATNLRRCTIVRNTGVAGTWAASPATTGQATCFGVDGSWLPFSQGALDEINGLPLDSLGDLGTIGSNSARFSTTYNPASLTWTHRHLFAGWLAGTGNNGDVIRVNADCWVHKLPARAA